MRGYIALLLQHALFGVINALGLVTRSVAATAGRRSPIRSTARHPATKESGRQGSATLSLQREQWALNQSDSCNEVEETSARAVVSTSATTTRGILTLLKERIATTDEGDEGCDTLLLYFAFGANMNPSILTNKRGVKPLRSFPAEATTFATGGAGGLCMCFCHRAGMYIQTRS